MTRKQRLTRKFLFLESLEDRLCLSSLPAGTTLVQPDAATQAHLTAAYGQLPLSFEVNKGQTDPRVNFLTQGAGYTAFLTHSGAVMELQHGNAGNVIAMKIVGANPASDPVGLDKQAGVSNDFAGKNASQSHTNIANYASVAYGNVYRGINLVYHGDQQQLEYNFVVKPGASAGTIKLAFGGAHGKSLDAQGNLVLHTSGGDVVENAPVAYQTINGVVHSVVSHFVVGRDGQVGFEVGRYDHDHALVIDPVTSLSYSTYLGPDTGTSLTAAAGIVVDASGDAYITGNTQSPKFPITTGAFLESGALIKSDGDGAFVTKFNAAGTALVYSTFLAGVAATGIAIDSAGNAYVTGWVDATGFATKNPFQAASGGGNDAFVTKLNATGSELIYSTYLGGSGDDQANGIAVDGSGNAYVIGDTTSTNFPTTPGSLQPSSSLGGGFVAKLNASGSALAYSTYLPGTASTSGNTGIAVDSSGNAYVTGFVEAPSFPTTPGAFQSGSQGGVFIAKLNPAGSAFVYAASLGGSTYYGKAYRIAVDGAGDAVVTGAGPVPTTPGAYQSTNPGAFVSELNAAGTALVYSTYIGGSGTTNFTSSVVGGIAVDSSGNIYVTGTTWGINFPANVTDDFPTKNAFQPTYGGGQFDVFVAKFDPSQVGDESLVYSSYLGGSDTEQSFGIAVDASGNAYVAGSTYSLDFPTQNAYQPQRTPQTTKHAGISNAFLTKIAFN
jgi:hypothetical protein